MKKWFLFLGGLVEVVRTGGKTRMMCIVKIAQTVAVTMQLSNAWLRSDKIDLLRRHPVG
jgi:hypothetical protein